MAFADEAIREVMNALIVEIAEALPEVMDNAKDTLKKHIDEDVLSESVYKPKVYKRRSDNNGLGVSLSAQAQMEPYTKIIAPTGGNVGGKLKITSRLYFNPSGAHKYEKWHTADYNELIGRIEKKSPAYTWGQDQVPPRPFWQRFIDEMIGGGEIEASFVDAMRRKGETVTADGGVTEDPYDREY